MSLTADRTEIEAIFQRLAKAHADRDAGAIVALYAPNAVIYDLAPPLGHRGMERHSVSEWLATWDGPIRIDIRDLELTIDGDLAFATALNRMRGLQGGAEQDLWFRSTTCFCKADGRWRIIHEHTSVPFYMDGSDQAALDLEP
ncbi:YybH family protein [Microbulbifer rhizosphaerae]|uniref:Uncharacterized protein (TIGR02246 family) n=1 Tax=Microbulbifer rhizosphaerae TaxID=1562603 RepID=A0A7W4WG73_9GAMM|nr:nuclear transport factor 2 family protein [Microbulbifer rhizosphaerae]MBB3063098.1 uncharacterized protein (TIGR02246 family) [Microbulbifer rhizosphaerae]